MKERFSFSAILRSLRYRSSGMRTPRNGIADGIVITPLQVLTICYHKIISLSAFKVLTK
nr:MAG TPA: hypothetical protein [Caudoviricetes sp.]